MKLKPPVTDYRNFNFKNLNTDEFRHLKLLLYWPFYGLVFLFVERFYKVDSYFPMHCPADDLIPFNELFVIPYMFWFVFLVGIHLYTLLYDIETFKKLMKYIMITYTFAIICYLIFPTCQQLRPIEFERDNILTRFMSGFYVFDTNTNVCPSIHVMGSLAVWSASMYTERFKTKGWQAFYGTTAILICMSTVFLKQHSLLDVLAAIPVCAVAHYVCYAKKEKSEKSAQYSESSV